MKKQILCSITTCFILIALLFPVKLPAAPFYEGKIIKIISGHEAGTGYDRMCRFLAMALPKHIPGKPTIIVENMPGGGSRIAANHLYNIAKPDGLTIGSFDRGIPFAQLLKAQGIKFDIKKFSWIGSPAVAASIFCIRSDLPYKTFDELRNSNKPIYVGSSGPSATDYQFCILLKEFAGVNIKFVNYPSSVDSR